MTIKTFGYCRVSTFEQNEDRQFQAMLDLEINERDIFIDKASGKDFERPQYQALKLQLREGDVLVIKSIERLGRNYKQICDEWREITRDIKANIRHIEPRKLGNIPDECMKGTLENPITISDKDILSIEIHEEKF